MSADRELQRRRRLAIREILKGSDPVADQKVLVEKLRELGFAAAQPSVSRDLKELGAVRSGGRYQIPSWTEEAEESPVRGVGPKGASRFAKLLSGQELASATCLLGLRRMRD